MLTSSRVGVELVANYCQGTSGRNVMATSLKRTAGEWASRSGLRADKCGLLRRLRSAIPLGDNLCSPEGVVEPVKAFGYVVLCLTSGREPFSLVRENWSQLQAR